MTELDARLVPKVKAILARYGKSVTITADQIAPYSVSEGKTQPAGVDSYDTKITPPMPWKMAPLPGSTVEAGDMSAYVADIPVSPADGMKVLFDDQTWTIVAVGRIYTGDLVAMYLLQLRS